MPKDGRLKSIFMRPLQLFVGLIQVFLNPVAAALLVAALGSRFTWPASKWCWVAVVPIGYFLWLLLFLLLAVLETTLIAPFFVRPGRYHQKEDGWFHFKFTVCWIFYNRLLILNSLPLVHLFLTVPWLNWLVLRAYAPRISLGKDTWITGTVWDPDVTRIGCGVIIGVGSQIVAHSLVRTMDGDYLYQSAPIDLGEHCVIGGDARVEMGAKIGAGALIEPQSRVRPFTNVPPGEIWGGNPAVFRAKRGQAPVAATIPAVAPRWNHAEAIRQLIASALNLPAESVTDETSAANCLAWDSMGKMAIAAALHDRFGISLPPETIFALDSAAEVAGVMAPTQNMPKAEAFELPANPELLPVFEPAMVLAALAQKMPPAAGAGAGARPKIPVSIAATFVAQPLAPTLELYARAFDLEVAVTFYDFNQVPQALLAPGSSLRNNRAGLNVVLIRPEDLPGNSPAERRAEAAQWLAAIKDFATTSGCALLVTDLPPVTSADRPELAREIPALQVWWRQELEPMAGVKILGWAEIITELGLAGARDTLMERVASTPYSAAAYQRLGVSLARALRATRVPPKKVLAVDGDNTLWGGVVGEDGAAGIQLGATGAGSSFRSFQAAILALKERGVWLVLVSKNLPEDVWEVLENHPEMLLRRNDFAGAKINWQPKSENLRALAAELNVGLDAMVLLDDNPAEQLEVSANCPEVTVVPLPREPDRYAEILSRLWLFDGAGETVEDKLRHDFTRQEIIRGETRKSAGTLEAYLTSLELKATVRPATEADLPRVVQLLQKTNQFNLSLKRHTLAETRALLPEHEIWTLAAGDRFGDYGLVGVGILRPDGDVLFLDSLLMSCRVLGRGLEEAFLHVIARRALEVGANSLRGQFVAGARNEPMKTFLETSAFVQTAGGAYEMGLAQPPAMPVHIRLLTSSPTGSGLGCGNGEAEGKVKLS